MIACTNIHLPRQHQYQLSMSSFRWKVYNGGQVDVVCTNLSNDCQSFTLQQQVDGNKLTWFHSIQSEDVVFQIERSTDGLSFEMIDEVAAYPTHNNDPYQYVDQSANTKQEYYYRIGLNTFTDQIQYTCPIRHLEGQATEQNVLIYPNPVHDHLCFSSSRISHQAQLMIYDLMGRKLLETILTNQMS